MKTKQCYRCLGFKKLNDFYKHPDMLDGHVNKCKDCNKLDNRTSNGTQKCICKICGKDFRTTKTEVNRGGGLTCSRNCFFIRMRKIIKRGEESPNWKGDRVGKHALHSWVYRNLGQPNKCTHCGTTEAKKFEWANKSQKYKRDLNDWIRLCTKCHAKYDKPTRYPKWKKTVITRYNWNVKK